MTLKEFEKIIIDMIKCGLSGQTSALPADFALEKIFEFSLSHQIFPIIFDSVKDNADFINDEKYAIFHKKYKVLKIIDELQRVSFEKIGVAFEESGIDYLPLKGIIYKRFYPSTFLRSMGDMDILIRDTDREKISDVMDELGYVFVKESTHELVFEEKPVITFELHKELVPTVNTDFYDYYKDPWRFAVKKEGHRFDMKDEDFFIFTFTHFARHYRDSGAGIKYIVDFYIYLKTHPDLDLSYIESEMKKLRIDVFFKNVTDLIGVWFYGKEETDVTAFLADRVFRSGSFGAMKFGQCSAVLREMNQNKRRSRVSKFFSAVFPSYSAMTVIYPSLKGKAVLLPLYYVLRIVSRLFRPKRTIKAIKEAVGVTEKQANKYKEELKFVGLDYEI